MPAAAQATKKITVKTDPVVRFRLKLTRDLTSGRVRVGDYVQFALIEDVKYPSDGGLDRDTIILKDTPVYGQVLDRQHRFTALKKGRFGIGKLSTVAIDGQRVDLHITRPEMPPELCVNKIPEKTLEAERKSKERHAKQEVEYKWKGQPVSQGQQNPKAEPCVNGRVYAGTFVSNLPSALLAVATATTLVRVKDNARDAVVAVTLADKIASQSGLSNIINGVDAEMGKDEIFEATINHDKPLEITVPARPPTASSVERVGRFTAPTPPGYLITDYFSDVVTYPSTPEHPGIYTGKVIERYTDKPIGSKMIMCEPQPLPEGWEYLDRKIDSKSCPREPGDTTNGTNYSLILKMH